jgi:hypothetical protein
VGIWVGFNKAKRSFSWGNNYERILGHGKGFKPMDKVRGKEFFNPNGSSGKVLRIDLPSVFISDDDGIEKELSLSSSTLVRKFREDLVMTDLKVDDFIVAVGEPNEKGIIEVKLIRIMDNNLPMKGMFRGLKK